MVLLGVHALGGVVGEVFHQLDGVVLIGRRCGQGHAADVHVRAVVSLIREDEWSSAAKLVELALANTDLRLAEGKPVTPAAHRFD